MIAHLMNNVFRYFGFTPPMRLKLDPVISPFTFLADAQEQLKAHSSGGDVPFYNIRRDSLDMLIAHYMYEMAHLRAAVAEMKKVDRVNSDVTWYLQYCDSKGLHEIADALDCSDDCVGNGMIHESEMYGATCQEHDQGGFCGWHAAKELRDLAQRLDDARQHARQDGLF